MIRFDSCDQRRFAAVGHGFFFELDGARDGVKSVPDLMSASSSVVSIGAVAIAIGVAASAAVSDVRHFHIPNLLTRSALLLGVVYHGVFSGWAGVGHALGGCALGLSLLLVPYLLGGFGGGDVKLLAAVGAWLGAPLLLIAFLVSSVLLGAVSLVLLLRSLDARTAALRSIKITWHQLRAMGNQLGAEERVDDVVLHENRRERLVPFGGVFAVGLVLVVVLVLMQAR